jgi:hypothetical protein
MTDGGRLLGEGDGMSIAGKNIGVIAGTTNARAVRDQLARRNLSATLVEFRPSAGHSRAPHRNWTHLDSSEATPFRFAARLVR